MSRIEPSRISQILASLVSAQSKAETSGRRHRTDGAKAGKARRDISVLRVGLTTRLQQLRQISPEDFESAAPSVLIQEVLLWEFGSEIVEHDAFKRVVSAISDTLQASPEARDLLRQLIARLSE